MNSRIKERPRLRKAILAHGLVPFYHGDGELFEYLAIAPEGHLTTLSKPMNLQIKKMVAEGCWSDAGPANRGYKDPRQEGGALENGTQ